MGTWEAGPFGNDMAADFVGGVVQGLMAAVDAFLESPEIDETFETGRPRDVFTGWMFASSPAVSALEHPVYDVWVVDCMKASNAASDSSG